MKRVSFSIAILAAALAGPAAYGQSIRPNPGFQSQTLQRNDDGSTGLIPMGFTINFFGKLRSGAYVNNNGNITFDNALATYTPFGLDKTEREIIGPFFADVDTRGLGSDLVHYGQDTVNGHKAFGVNYINVGYYNSHFDKLNSFQVVLIDRSDTGDGNFDLEFNYGHITWETGDASGGVNGFGGVPASVGWSNGTGDPGTSFQLPGSLIPGSFLDNGPHALYRQTLNTVQANNATPVQGRLKFRARDGVISPGLSITTIIPPNGTVGTAYSARLTATGANPPFRWTLKPDITAPPGLSVTTDGAISGTPTEAGTYSFTLSVTATTEDGDLTAYARGSLTIDPAAVSIATTCPLADATVGQPYSILLSATGSSTGYTWSVDNLYSLPPGVGLSQSGLLAGTPLVPGSYIFDLHARSNSSDGTKPAQLLCHFNVNPAAVQLTSGCAMPAGTVGVPYAQWLSAAGGYGPYQFQLLGQLPLGLALTPDGLISGMPSGATSLPFRVSVTDSRGTVTSQGCSIAVNEPVLRLDSDSFCPLPPATTGAAYTAYLPSKYIWSTAGTLPAGLSLTPDGTISGTPMTAGPSRFLLLASDHNGNQAGQICSLAVLRGPLAVNGCPLPDASAGIAYHARVSALGGSAPYELIVSGALPAGIQMSLGGQLSGTPSTAGLYSFGITMQGSGQTFTQACSLNVNPTALQITSACPLPDAQLGLPYSAQIAAAGGTAPYQFDFFGYLPEGIQPSGTGSLSGTPDVLGGEAFLVRVTDAQNRSTVAPCSLNVALPPAPQIHIGSLPAIVPAAATNVVLPVELAQPYSQPIQGEMVLRIRPDTRSTEGEANQADPRLRFTNGLTTANFTLPAGSTRIALPLVSTGTVASTVTVALSNLQAGGGDLGLFPTPQIFKIAPAAPVVTSACYTLTATGINLQINGYSTTRELTRGDVTVGPQTFETDLTGIAAGFFSDPQSIAAGGTFALTIPYDVAGTKIAPGSVSVNVLNTVGAAGSQTAQFCQ